MGRTQEIRAFLIVTAVTVVCVTCGQHMQPKNKLAFQKSQVGCSSQLTSLGAEHPWLQRTGSKTGFSVVSGGKESTC